MDLRAAILATAPAAPAGVLDAIEAVRDRLHALGALASTRRAAHLVGQCAYESAGFRRRHESLYYTSAARLMAVWPGRFPSRASALPFLRSPVKLANHVYAGRMGNGDAASGDGFRYRGRGWLQLTGRANYRHAGRRLGLNLENSPERAAEPATAWLIAADYLARRRRRGRTAFEWADLDDAAMVTRIVNGGLAGLAERRRLTARALDALAVPATADRPGAQTPLAGGAHGEAVVQLQRRLAAAGFAPGPVDGVFGPRTAAALRAFQAANGLPVTGIADAPTRARLAARAA